MGEWTLCVPCASNCRGHRAAQLAHGVDGQLLLAGTHWPMSLDHTPLMVLAPLANAWVDTSAVETALGDGALRVSKARLL